MAGQYVGWLWSRNAKLLAAYRHTCGRWHLAADTKWVLEQIFCDRSRRDRLIALLQERLSCREKWAAELLGGLGLRFDRYENSLFFMLDLRDLGADSAEGEMATWKLLLEEYKVMILPGMAGFHAPVAGRFRVLWTGDQEAFEEAVRRLGRFVADRVCVSSNE